MVLAILLVSLLAISAVSAADNATSDVFSVEETTDEVVSVENTQYVSSINEKNNYLSANPNGTFTDLANEIANSNGELNLTRNYVYYWSDVDYFNGINISKEITINGNGFSVNGNNQSKIFYILSSADHVILNNISFINALSSENHLKGGSAIYCEGKNCVVSDCNFINCSSLRYSGGAVYWRGDDGILVNSNFINCSSSMGSAVYWTRQNGSLYNCSFVECLSNYAGVIYWSGILGNLYNCSFYACAVSSNGIIYWNADNGFLFNSSFINCSSLSGYSGAVYWKGANGTIHNLDFLNSPIYSVYIDGINCTLFDCNCIDCNSYFANIISKEGGTIFNCSFVNCKSDMYIVTMSENNATLFNCRFVNCTPKTSTVSIGGNTGNMFGCSFVNCNSSNVLANIVSFGNSGDLFDCSFVNCSFYENIIKLYGENATASNCQFLNCYSKKGGGHIIECTGKANKVFNFNFTNYSNVISWRGVGGNLFDCNFVNCSSERNSIYWHGKNGKAYNCNFINCSHSSNDVFYWYGVDGSIYNSSFINSDNVIYCSDSNLSVDNCNFLNSSSIQFITLRNSNCSISNCNFINIHTYYGIVYQYESNALILNCYFEKSYETFYSKENVILNSTSSMEISHEKIIEAGSDFTVIVNLNSRVTGHVKLILDDEEYGGELNYGRTSIVIPNLIAGNHTFTINYMGDSSFNQVIVNDSVESLFKESFVGIDVNDIYCNESIVLNPILPSNISGVISIFLDDKFYANISAGNNITLNNLLVGNHTIKSVYSGDKYFKTCENITSFNVFKVDSKITILDCIVDWNSSTIDVLVNERATGSITVSINNKNYTEPILNGASRIYVNNLKHGKYYYTINYSGNQNFNPTSFNGYFIIPEKIMTFSDLANQIKNSYGQLDLMGNYVYNAISDASYKKGIKIDKTIKINGNGFYISGNNVAKALSISASNVVIANLTFINCSSDNYHQGLSDIATAVYWSGYDGNLINCTFMNCYSSNVKITGTNCIIQYCTFIKSNSSLWEGFVDWDGVYGVLSHCNFSSCISSGSNAISWNGYGGKLLNSNFKFFSYSPVVMWMFKDGDIINCTFNGNSNLKSNIDNRNIFIKTYNEYDWVNYYKLNPHFSVNMSDFYSSDAGKIIVSLAPEATGTMYIYLYNSTNNKLVKSYSPRCYNGQVYNLYNQKYGNYSVVIKYSGDDYFTSKSVTLNCNVLRHDSEIKLDLDNISHGESLMISPIISNQYSGEIDLYLDNSLYSTIAVGQELTINDLSTGNHEIHVIYKGDNYYKSCEYKSTFVVFKNNSKIEVSSYGIYENEVMFSITTNEDATGNITINFNDENYSCEIDEGEAEIYVPIEDVGYYTFNIIYSGDSNYNTKIFKYTEYLMFETDFGVYSDVSAGYGVEIPFNFNDDVTGHVVITLFNKTFSQKIVDGEIKITIGEIKPGNYTYYLNYSGDSKYNSFEGWGGFTVIYSDSPIDIDFPKITYGDSVKFTPTLPNGASGNISLLIDNDSLANISAGNSYQYGATKGGKHYLTIRYSGDEYFAQNETTVEFYVNKLDSNFSIENTFGSERYITIPITLSEDANGDITVNINNNIYSGKVVNGSFNFTVTDIGVGTHNLVINYTNDNKYNDIYIAKEINVNLKDSNLNLDIQNILSGQNLLIKPTLTEGATGSVDIYVDGSFKKSINVGSSYTLQNPGVGQHKIRLVYSGNTYFESSKNEYSFRVFTIYPIEAVDTQIVFGTDKKFQAKFFDEYGGVLANKYVLFIVNGEEYPVKTNGEGIAVLDVDLEVGEYNITSVSLLDENTTNKLLIFHSVQAESMMMEYGSDTRFKATFLDETAKPLSNTNIVFKVDGKDTMVKTDVNGVAILNSELTLGTHAITSINTITDESMTNKVVVVKDVNSIITVETKDINYNQKATIKVNIDSGYLNANVTIKVTDENGYEQIFTQKAAKTITEELSNLNASKYYVGVKYVDSDLLVIQKNATFNVLKIDPAVTLSVDDEFAGQTITFEVKVSDSNGTLIIKIDEDLSDGQLVDGIFVMNINSLSVGKHSYEILFNGDKNYNPIIKKGTFAIWNKLNFKVDFDSIEIYGDDECTMYVHIQNLSDNKNAILTLFIDGVEVKDQSFTIYEYDDEEYSGEIEFNASNLSEGIHNWKISYYDGLNYINSSQTGLVKVYHVGNPDKVLLVTNDGIIADIEGEFVFVKNGTIINDDYQEYYTIYSFTANGVEYAAIRWFPVTFYSVGCYKVFNPNEYKLFEGVYYKTTNGIISDVIDSYEEIDGVYYGYVGRPYEYYNNGYDKSYAIINGTCYKSQFYHYYEASEGVDYNVLDGIFYTMDGIKIDDERENYDGFVIIKNGRYYFNDNLYFHHIMSTVGYEYVKINNDFYRLIQTYENEELHNYALIDGKLYPVIGNSIGKPVNLDVRDIISEDEISIPSLDDISGDESVEIKLPSDATGTVTLTVNGKDYKFDVKNGVSNVKLPELTDGNYDYTITYSGDNKYSSFSTNGNMGVNNTKPEDTKPTPQIVIPPLDKPSADGLVTIALPGDATGKVTLSINGKDYSYLVENGVANVIIPNLGEGNYPYTITYSGDSKYSQFTTNGVLNKTAPKLNPKITAKNTVVQYSAKGKYSVTVYGTNGKVARGVQVIFKISGKQVAKVKTNVKGVASYVVTKNPAKYKIQATALGKSVTKTLTVKHIVTLKTVTLKKSAKKITLQATLAKVNGKYLKKKTITFKINGKKVASAKTNSKGVAKITIKNPNVVKKLKVGKKITYQATYLKDTVKKTAKIKK